jgi:magnesium-transporting ATPase (P-type)
VKALLGLTEEEAQRRLARYGPNRIPRPRGPGALALLLRQLVHFFALLLWAAAFLAYLAGTPELAWAIVAVILVNGIFAFAQEYRAERTAEHLLHLVPQRVQVLRNGRWQMREAWELVPGDVIRLTLGNRVPADVRVLEALDLAVDASAFTGESLPERPSPGDTLLAAPWWCGARGWQRWCARERRPAWQSWPASPCGLPGRPLPWKRPSTAWCASSPWWP